MKFDRLKELEQKINALTLRERALVFVAGGAVLVTLLNATLLDPLLAQQKKLSSQVIQQQEKMKALQAQINEVVRARENESSSPLRQRIVQLQQQLDAGEAYLQGRRDKLVAPERMAQVLEQVLARNAGLQLVALNTLPVSSFSGTPLDEPVELEVAPMYKHGVEITVRGSYANLVQYLTALEGLSTQMFWGAATMNVVQYPVAELKLTLYTLSLDKTWLRV